LKTPEPASASVFVLLFALVPANPAWAAPNETHLADGPNDAGSRSHLLLAPFAAPRANYLHSALEVPPFEPGWTLPRGNVLLRLRTAHGHSTDSRTLDGFKNTFDGLYHEWADLRVDWGVTDRLEIGAHTAFTGWDEEKDRFDILDSKGAPIVTDEHKTFYGTGASSRHDNFSVLGIKAKYLLLEDENDGLDLSLATSVKFPIGRPGDLTSAGTYDLAFTLMGSVPLGRAALHANLGTTIPLGSQNLFESEADVELAPFVHGAVGITYPLPAEFAVGLQLEANSSAFGDVEFLEDPPFNVTGGVRKILGNFVLEAGGGTGLNWESSYKWMFFLSAGYLF
jgi:hypothetical protein